MTQEVITPVNEQGNPMSPYEADTGVVLSIWAPGGGNPNRHHPHFFKKDYEKRGPRSKRGFLRPVRFSRLQLVNAGTHTRYHCRYEGTEYPADKHAGFMITILNMSGYIAPFVVDMSQRRTAIKETTPAMREALRQPGIMTMEGSQQRIREIGNFLMYYAIKQNFSSENVSLVEEFIGLPNPQADDDPAKQARRETLGLRLIDAAIERAVDPVEACFKEARAIQALRVDAAPTAFETVKAFVSGYEHDYYDALQKNLARQLANAA